tara:strand:+ start:47 stop:460 length:414 start_codon:yes stop_codon:yes gene_type:complete
MKRLLFVLCISLLFGSCEEEIPYPGCTDSTAENYDPDATIDVDDCLYSGTVKLEVTCQTVPFEVSYHNQYENDITETSNTNYWSKDFEALTGHHCTLNFDNPVSTKVNCSMSIKWQGSVLTSFDGEVSNYELIQAFP